MSHVPAEHRYTRLPDFETGNLESMISVASHSRSHSHGHVGSCGCNCMESISYQVVMDERWKRVGVGCAEDARWVVELWEPEPEPDADADTGAAPSVWVEETFYE
jgi:hypothetical protein